MCLFVFHCTIKLALLRLLALDMEANTCKRLTIETAPAGDPRLSKQVSIQESDFLLCGQPGSYVYSVYSYLLTISLLLMNETPNNVTLLSTYYNLSTELWLKIEALIPSNLVYTLTLALGKPKTSVNSQLAWST